MNATDRFNRQPFQKLLGIEITESADGRGAGQLPLRQEHSSNPETLVAHGGVVGALVDSVGGAAAVSLCDEPTPTIDLRVDYRAPATDDLFATSEVVRGGGQTALVDVEVRDAAETPVASGRGLYKIGGRPADAPWGFEE
ncbi:MAG: PaaI family thioesterase [Haloarculaceae archaeon]